MVAITTFFFLFRRLHTLNKCASMKLDVNFQRKKVGVYTLLRSWFMLTKEVCIHGLKTTGTQAKFRNARPSMFVFQISQLIITIINKSHYKSRLRSICFTISLCFHFDQRVLLKDIKCLLCGHLLEVSLVVSIHSPSVSSTPQ